MSANSAFTIPNISYSNTFGDWIVATNNLIIENNYFATGGYIKPTGTLYLNDNTLGLSVANNATFGGLFQVSGVGSSASIQNNLVVGNQVYFTNTYIGLTNSGQMNVGGVILALSANTGLNVSNNAIVGGVLTVTKTLNVVANAVVNVLQANTSVNTASLSANTVYTPLLYAGSLVISGNIINNGTTINNSNNITLSANTTIPVTSYFSVYRGGGVNQTVSIRWNEGGQYWDLYDLGTSSYLRLMTLANLSSSLVSNSTAYAATSNAVSIIYSSLLSTNTYLQGTITASVSGLTTTVASAYTTANNALANTNGAIFGGNLTVTGNVTSNLIGNITGNANTVTNGLYVSAIGNTIPSVSGTGATGSWNINAATVTNGLYVSAIGNTIPSVSGTGASGTWGINITGNAPTSNVAVLASSLNPTVSYTVAGISTPSGNGAVGMVQGNQNNSGYVQFVAANGNRQGYIGYSSTNGATDTGLITLQCGQFAIVGNTTAPNMTISGTLNAAIVNTTSDENKKTAIRNIRDGLKIVNQLNGVNFNWKDSGEASAGLIAQDVEKVMPELVVETGNGKALNYNGIIGALVESVKELTMELALLKAQIESK